MTETAQRLSDVTGTVAARCTRSDMMLSQAHDEVVTGSQAAPAALNALSQIQRTANHVGEVSQILADLARQSNAAAFTLQIELGRDRVDKESVGVIVEEGRRLADRSSQAAMEITRLVEDIKLEVNQGYDATRRGESAFGRATGIVEKCRENVATAAELVRSQQILVADEVRLIADLDEAGGPGPDEPEEDAPQAEPADVPDFEGI